MLGAPLFVNLLDGDFTSLVKDFAKFISLADINWRRLTANSTVTLLGMKKREI